jgi:superfamily I DNA and/or RNA helicase
MHHILLVTVDSARKVHRMRRNPKMVVDEFSQVNAMDFFAAVERVCGAGGEQAPLLQGLALLGDPLQLPLVTTQSELRTNILHYLEYLFHSRTLPRHRLKKQYRMNRVICEGVNMIRVKAWNTYRLETAEEVANRRFEASLPGGLPEGIREALDPDHPLVLVDTSDLGDERRGFGQVAGDCSVSNPAEARLATELAWAAMRGTNPKEVRVLTPYSAQVRAIGEGLEERAGPVGREAVSTVWRAQGQEWPCVIVSLVRSNDDRRLGFLGDEILKAQLYVAVSRAQAKLVVLAAYKRTFEGHKDVDALWETPGALKLRGKDLCR